MAAPNTEIEIKPDPNGNVTITIKLVIAAAHKAPVEEVPAETAAAEVPPGPGSTSTGVVLGWVVFQPGRELMFFDPATHFRPWWF